MKKFDVIIFGSGPAATSSSCALVKNGLTVCIVDVSHNPNRLRIGECLPSAAWPLLQSLGLEATLLSGEHLTSFGNLSAWGNLEGVHSPHASDSLKDPNGHGWHLNRAKFDYDLLQDAIRAGVDLSEGRVTDVDWLDEKWIVTTDQKIQICAPWIIDASGRRAQLANHIGIKTQKTSELFAIYSWSIVPKSDLDSRSVIEASKDGWWYSARLPSNHRVVSFQTNVDTARAILHEKAGSRRLNAFNNHMNETRLITRFFPNGLATEPLHVSKVGSCRLSQFVGANWIAVGDAAMALDPLSAQGLFNALYTGRAAGLALTQHFAGRTEPLREYVRTLESIWQIYEGRRKFYYALENRWCESTFWKSQIFLNKY